MAAPPPDARSAPARGRRSLARWSDGAVIWLYRLVAGLAARLPLPAGYWLAGALGELYYWANPGHSRHAVANLAVVLAQHPAAPAVRRLARQSFRYYAMYLLDFLRQPTLPPTQAEHGALIHGWEHLDAALARGRGAIIVALHCGSWDRGAAALAARGYRAHVLVDTFQPPALDAAIQRARAGYGLGVIAAESGAALRRVYAALHRNEIVFLLVDRPQRDKGTPVLFFGRPTWLPSGPAMLARRTGAVLLHGYLLRRPDLLTYQGMIEPPIECEPTGSRDGDEAALMRAIVAHFERLIQRHPEQWYMFRPMWPSRESATADEMPAAPQPATD